MKITFKFTEVFNHSNQDRIEDAIEVFEVALSNEFAHIASGDEFRRYNTDVSDDPRLLKFEEKVKQAITDYWMTCSTVPGGINDPRKNA